jgi:dual specificity tyrosine-phosphorylation-regulated kinase 2/3/4
MSVHRGSAKAISPVVANGPTSPEDAVKRFGQFLTEYERQEIFDFPDIYFVGNRNNKLIPDEDLDNQGFDDDGHNYKLVVGDHLAYRFEIISLFGAGAFGQVAKCFDHKNKTAVAVKVIVNTEQMHEQGRIEAQVLSKLNTRDQRHIVHAFDYFVFRSHICITFEILGMNLYELSESNEFKPLPARLVRLYALQMFSALDQVHRVGAIHCDMKPENVLLVPGSNTLVKLIDFGSSCFDGYQKYEYIQSRFYRAPEVIIGIPYGPPMDIWSTALIVVELLIGRPLFPGDDEEEQMAMIAELLGDPDWRWSGQAKRREEFFDEDGTLKRESLTVMRFPKTMNLRKILGTSDAYLIDFIMKCLEWDPEKRMTASQAMQHPWIRMKEVQMSSKQDASLPMLRTANARL